MVAILPINEQRINDKCKAQATWKAMIRAQEQTAQPYSVKEVIREGWFGNFRQQTNIYKYSLANYTARLLQYVY